MRIAFCIIGWLVSTSLALWLLWYWAFAPLNYMYDGPVDSKSWGEFIRHVFPVRLVPMSKFGDDDNSVGAWSICESVARSATLIVLATAALWTVLLLGRRRQQNATT